MADLNRAHPHASFPAGRRIALLLVSVVAGLLAVVPAASAATVGVSGSYQTLYYIAGSGETNNVTVSLSSGTFTVSDPAANMTAQYGCTTSDAHHASCPSTSVKHLYLSTGDLGDTIAVQAATPAYVNCGTGSDTVTSTVTTSDYLTPTGCESVNAPVASPATPTPSPVSPPSPLAAPLVIDTTVTTMSTTGTVSLPLVCDESANAPCTGTLVIQLAKKSAGKSDATASRRGAPNILGRKEISLAKGGKKKVNVSMSSRGRSFVKRHRRVHTKVVIRLKRGGVVTTNSQALTIKAPSRKR
jgi:hypothetical protein